MTHGPRYRVKPRRHRQCRTDYRRRYHLLKSRKTRIVVRKTIKQVIVQFIEYQPTGDIVVASAVSSELKEFTWDHSLSSTPAAYLTGLLAGKRASAKGITHGILDIGRGVPSKGSKVFAALKGVVDAGIQCPCDESRMPSEERLQGAHLKGSVADDVKRVKKTITEVK